MKPLAADVSVAVEELAVDTMMMLVEPSSDAIPDGRMLNHRDDRCNVALCWTGDEVVVDQMLLLKVAVPDERQRCCRCSLYNHVEESPVACWADRCAR